MDHISVVTTALMLIILVVLWVVYIVLELRQTFLTEREHYMYQERPVHKGPPFRFERHNDIYKGSYKDETMQTGVEYNEAIYGVNDDAE